VGGGRRGIGGKRRSGRVREKWGRKGREMGGNRDGEEGWGGKGRLQGVGGGVGEVDVEKGWVRGEKYREG